MRQILRLFLVVKFSHKCKVFEWQAFLILMSTLTVLNVSSTSASCCSIVPGETWNINFFIDCRNNLISNNLMYDCC